MAKRKKHKRRDTRRKRNKKKVQANADSTRQTLLHNK